MMNEYMAIRIREVDGHTIAVCAAATKPKKGDLYLDDTVHHALSTKFGVDWHEEGQLDEPLADDVLVTLMKREEMKKTDSETCIECQECCNWLTFILPSLSDDQKDFYERRGCRIVDQRDGGYGVMVPSHCQYLGFAGCIIYNDRPGLCRIYDGRVDPFMINYCQLPK